MTIMDGLRTERYIMRHIVGIILSLVITTVSVNAETKFTSTEQQTRLLELYTSEGCSSCPPADKWLSGFKTHPDLWTHIIPVAFHVDYWDYIGWKDRFAEPEYGERHYLYRVQGNIRQVYTPGMVLDGREWRGWFRGKKQLGGNTQKSGVLSLTVNGDEFEASFDSVKPKNNTVANLYIAVLGFDLKTPVRAGENEGELLNHDFVVLALNSYDSNRHQWQGKIPKANSEPVGKAAIVAWVSYENNIRPVQAVGGWFEKE